MNDSVYLFEGYYKGNVMIHKIFHQNPVLSSRDFIPIFSCSDGSDVALYQERSKNDVWPCQSRYTKDICALPEQYDQSVFCFNVEVDCKGEMFICEDRTQCIYKTSFCDGYRDCRWDEMCKPPFVHYWTPILKILILVSEFERRLVSSILNEIFASFHT